MQDTLPRADLALNAAPAGLPRPPVRSLYIHTPFCVHKCHYCDFYSFVDTRDQQDAFVDRLVSELHALAPHAAGQPLQTLFIGGGTPSLLRVALWQRLLNELERLFDLSWIRRQQTVDARGLAEFTVECNPESATPELMEALRAGGVSRISVGAQSFHHQHLKTLERWHNPDNVERAISAARQAGISRQSVDLIFAIPGQSLDEWDADLQQALSLGTEHLSCYNLTYEPNTAMTRRLMRGDFDPVPDELEIEMFTHAARVMAAAGLRRYEVSNYARPGAASRHNMAYWLQEQWLAAGPSASGHAWAAADPRAGSVRWKNVPRLGDYLASSADFSPVVDLEPAEPARLIREKLMTGLRLAEGVSGRGLLEDLEMIHAPSTAKLRAAVGSHSDRGLVRIDAEERWTLTDAGVLLADRIASELMACIG